MCGRYTLAVEVSDLLQVFTDLVIESPLERRYNIAPTQQAPVVLNDGKRTVASYRWGLVPSWAQDVKMGSRLINARSESLAAKPSFRLPFRLQRCLVLADGFYEWRPSPGGGAKSPVHLRLRSGLPFAFAGLWEKWKDAEGRVVPTFTIVTTPTNELIAPFHDRMPAILRPEAVAAWLDPAQREPGELSPHLQPYPAELMEARQVSRLVNSPANDSPECLAAESL